jgi:hemolysin activation/secretion protein
LKIRRTIARGLVTPRRSALAGLCVSVIATAIHAQTPPPSPAQAIDEGLRRQAERERAQQQANAPRADALRPAERNEGVPALPDEQPCFVITAFELSGPDAVRFRWLTGSTATFVDRCIGAQGLSRIAAYLDRQLTEQGYVTSRVGLGPQNLSSGRVVFHLNTGRIAEIRMVDADQPTKPVDQRWGTWRNAFPTSAGSLLDARDLEQGVEQMKRLPSQDITTTLSPGELPDTSIVTIERHSGGLAERLRGGVTLDNSGGPALGRGQLSANVGLDNPLGINDVLTFSANGNVENPSGDHRSQGISLDYSVPAGYGTLSVDASHSRFAQVVQLPTLPHLSSGDADTASLQWQQTVLRTASSKTGVHAIVSMRQSRSFLDGTELLAQHRRTTFLEAGFDFKRLFADGASVEAHWGYRRGASWFDAEADLRPDPLDPGAVPTLRPRIWLADGSMVLPFRLAERSWQLSSTFRGQSTRDHTLSIDQLAIGNRYTVRGFDGDSVLIAESGWTWRNELSTPVTAFGIDGSPYVGVDCGRVWGPSDVSLVGQDLAGAAMGVRGRFKALQFDVAVAAPLGKPARFHASPVDFYASTTYAF